MRSTRGVAREFNARQSERPPIHHGAAVYVNRRFRATGNELKSQQMRIKQSNNINRVL